MRVIVYMRTNQMTWTMHQSFSFTQLSPWAKSCLCPRRHRCCPVFSTNQTKNTFIKTHKTFTFLSFHTGIWMPYQPKSVDRSSGSERIAVLVQLMVVHDLRSHNNRMSNRNAIFYHMFSWCIISNTCTPWCTFNLLVKKK